MIMFSFILKITYSSNNFQHSNSNYTPKLSDRGKKEAVFFQIVKNIEWSYTKFPECHGRHFFKMFLLDEPILW